MQTFQEFCVYKAAKEAGIDVTPFDDKELKMGVDVEREHDGEMGKDTDVVKKDSDLVKIAVAHLREDPKYYTKLKKVEEE